MTEKREWKEFIDAGLLWWINRILHLFGWVIAYENNEDGTIREVYPARCKYKGFDGESETEGFKKLTKHIEQNISLIKEDV